MIHPSVKPKYPSDPNLSDIEVIGTNVNLSQADIDKIAEHLAPVLADYQITVALVSTQAGKFYFKAAYWNFLDGGKHLVFFNTNAEALEIQP